MKEMNQEDINFKSELEKLINRYSQENKSNTPDFILCEYILNCYWSNPIEELNKNDVTITLTSDETKAINDRIDGKIQRAEYILRKNENKATEHASKAFITF